MRAMKSLLFRWKLKLSLLIENDFQAKKKETWLGLAHWNHLSAQSISDHFEDFVIFALHRSYFQMGSGLWLTMNHQSFSDSPILELNRCWTLLLLNGVQKPFLSTLSSEYQQMYDICKWEGSRLCKVWQILEMHRRWWTWCWKRQSNQFRLLRVKSWSCYLWLTLFNISYNIIIQYL